MAVYDIAVIGTGPAGVSAAITASLRGKSVLLLGSRSLSAKIVKAHTINNYPGLPAVSGAELAEKLRAHLDERGIEITERQIKAVYAMGDKFVLDAGTEMFEALTVIAATGVMQGGVLKGEDELLGRGVSYCATCDAALYKGKKVAVLGYSDDAPEEAEFLAETVAEVIYLPMNGKLPKERGNLTVVNEKPLEIQRSKLITDKGEHEAACVFVLRDAVMPDKLIPGVEVEGPHIKVDGLMQTNLEGLYACGDIAGKPYQYIKAAGQGNIAALSAVTYLAKRK